MCGQLDSVSKLGSEHLLFIIHEYYYALFVNSNNRNISMNDGRM